MRPSTPDLLTMLTELIATPSVSCTAAHWDQSNLGVIEKLETWLSALGFQTEVMAIPGHPQKANLIATLGAFVRNVRPADLTCTTGASARKRR